jgi:hypothetical protein
MGLLLTVLSILASPDAHPQDEWVRGTAVPYRSPGGVQEHCVSLDRMPDGVYLEEDRAEEQLLSGIDFYDGSHALCPKVFSTSPGTLVYDLSAGLYAGRPDAFEAEQCGSSSPAKRGATGRPVTFKTTMNDPRTSATFAAASLLYYHFSRYFRTDVHVPVSVYRSMDRKAHLARVTERGFALSARRTGAAMNHAGWQVMKQAEEDPSAYKPADELFTPDRTRVHGVLLRPDGDRYGPEVNGTRESGWGEGQNRDFQETAPFRALRSDLPLRDAIAEGRRAASSSAVLRQAMGHGVSDAQMVFWMKEITEIVLLDYILSQQDRIGNIDYVSWWYWVEEGNVRRMPAGGSGAPADIADRLPVRLKRTVLNDNDAGGRIQYANFTKKTGMLEKVRHIAPDTYRRLVRLADDFAAQGELYAYVRDTFGLSAEQVGQIVANTRAAADIVRATCRAGKLRFDLDPSSFFASGRAAEQMVDCANP